MLYNFDLFLILKLFLGYGLIFIQKQRFKKAMKMMNLQIRPNSVVIVKTLYDNFYEKLSYNQIKV